MPDLVQTEESCVIFLTSLISRDAIFICGIMRAKTIGLASWQPVGKDLESYVRVSSWNSIHKDACRLQESILKYVIMCR